MMRVGWDLDDVVYDIVDSIRTFIHKTTKRPLESMPDAETWSFYKDHWNMTREEFMMFFADGINKGFIFRYGKPLHGSAEAIRTLYGEGHEIHLVSARAIEGAEDMALHNTRLWLADNEIPYDSLTISDNKACIETDIFLDDRVENYETLDEAGMYPWLFTRPWNALHPGRRVVSHAQFVEIVRWREEQLNKGRVTPLYGRV